MSAAAEPQSASEIMGGSERTGLTLKIEFTDQTHGGVVEGYVTGNVGVDGELREVFLHGFGKDGSTLRGWTDFAAIVLSLALQSGTPLETVATRVGQMKFEPYGPTINPEIPFAPSVPAYIVAWLALRFGDESAQKAMREVMEGWA